MVSTAFILDISPTVLYCKKYIPKLEMGFHYFLLYYSIAYFIFPLAVNHIDNNSFQKVQPSFNLKL